MQAGTETLAAWSRGIAAVLLATGCLALGPGTARSQETSGPGPVDEVATSEVTASAETQARSPWRGSFFNYRNQLSVNTLDASADLTWNPFWAMAFTFQPRWWFGDMLNIKANLDLGIEITNADDTTYYHEPVLGDLTLSVGMSNFYTIPVLGIALSADLSLVTPTSKISQARTLVLGIAPSLRLARKFDVLEGLSLGYTLKVTGNLHRYTTAQRETDLIPLIVSNPEDAHSGLRNARASVLQTGDLSLGILDWLSATIAFGGVIGFLYPLSDTDLPLSADTDHGVDKRWATVFDVGLAFQAMPSLSITLGYNTTSPQLAPDSTYYNPLYNKYSLFYLDLQVDVDGLYKQITQADGED